MASWSQSLREFFYACAQRGDAESRESLTALLDGFKLSTTSLNDAMRWALSPGLVTATSKLNFLRWGDLWNGS